MPGLLTTASVLICPHGGSVSAITSNTQANAGGAPLVGMSDTFLIAGCPFTLPGTPPIPSPCLTVQWLVGDTRSKVSGDFTLSEASTGLCLAATQAPQGSVIIANTQPQVSGE